MDRVRKLVRAKEAHKRGYTGTGVTVAVMDTGAINHPDFEKRIVHFIDFTSRKTGMYDDNSHGTHVCGIIGGNGFASHGKYMGIAPGVRFVVLKVLDRLGNGNTNQVIRALHWIIDHRKEYGIRVLNISVGMLQSAKIEERNRLIEAVEEVWNHQIIVVAAAGNNGPTNGSITIPGSCKTIITVGSSDDDRIKTTGIANGYSGRGPTRSCVMKPELVAPGTAIMSCSIKKTYEKKSGTSMATPVVTGAIALLLNRYPHLTPAQVKLRLYETAVDVGKSQHIQGWGQIDIPELLWG